MAPTGRTSVVRGALIYLAMIGGLTAVAVVLKSDFLSIAILGPVMLIFAGIGTEETEKFLPAISLVYLAIILAPTGVALVRVKWSRALIVFQVVLLLPNILLGFFVIIISGTQM